MKTLVLVGLPYTWQGQMGHHEATGGQGERQPSANALEGARFQGRHTAETARKLAAT